MTMLTAMPGSTLAVLALVVVASLFCGWRLFSVLRDESRRQQRNLTDQIQQLLPQTQCGQCGYSGCAPYARAIAAGDAINKCPPGGTRTIRQLSRLLQLPVVPLDPAHGTLQAASIAFIRESECIGCTKCIQACPVDAILGAARLMHTVIVAECTGCELCVEPCPVDCIEMRPLPGSSVTAAASWQAAAQVSHAAGGRHR